MMGHLCFSHEPATAVLGVVHRFHAPANVLKSFKEKTAKSDRREKGTSVSPGDTLLGRRVHHPNQDPIQRKVSSEMFV